MKNLTVFLFIFLSSLTKGALKKDVQNMISEFLGPINEPKLKMTAKEWNKSRAFENHFPNSGPVNLFQNVQTLGFTWIDPENLMEGYENEKAVFEDFIQDIQKTSWDDVFTLFEGLSGIPMELRRSSFVRQLMFKVAENVDVNIANELGHTPLMIAAGIDEKSVAKLLQRGAQVETIDSFGFSALHHAVYIGMIENKNIETPTANIFKILLDHGASTETKDRSGKTALEVAKIYLDEDDERIAILQKAAKTKKKLQQMFREFAEIQQYRVAQNNRLWNGEAERKRINELMKDTYAPPKRNQPTSKFANRTMKQPRPRTNKGTRINK